jgi:hypothetical protein
MQTCTYLAGTGEMTYSRREEMGEEEEVSCVDWRRYPIVFVYFSFRSIFA